MAESVSSAGTRLTDAPVVLAALAFSILLVTSAVPVGFIGGASAGGVSGPAVDNDPTNLADDAVTATGLSTTTGVANLQDGETLEVRHEGPLFLSDSNSDLYIGSSDDLVVAANESILEAYDSSGDNMWSVDLGTHRMSDPVSDGDVVAVAFEDDLRLYDAEDGTLLWNSSSTTETSVDRTPPVLGEYVYASGRLYGPEDELTVYAYHRENGSVAWQNEIGGDPISLGGDEDTLLVEQDDTVMRLNASTGDVEWNRNDWPLSEDAEAPPVVGDGTVFVVDESFAYAFNLTTGVPEWRTPLNDDIDVAPVAVDDSVYVASGGTVHDLDSETGAEQARYRTNGTVLDLAHDDGTLYVGSEDGRLYALDGSLDPVWQYDLPPATGDVDHESWAYRLEVTNESLGTLVATDPQLGDIQPNYHSLSIFTQTNASVTDVQASTATATPGDSITATASVSNDGTESAEVDVTFAVDGPFTPADPDRYVETVTVAGGSTADVTTEFQVNTTGEYTVTAYESGTDELAIDVRPGNATVTVSHTSPDHDWEQEGFDRGGTDSNPLTNAPAGPLEQVWKYQPESTFDLYGTHPPLVEDGLAFVHNETHIAALDIETGDVEWEFIPQTTYEADQDNVEIRRHAVADGTLYFTMHYYNGSASQYDYTARVYALDAGTGTAAWGDSGPTYVTFEDQWMNDDVLAVDDNQLLVEANEPFDNRTIYQLDRIDGSEENSYTHVQSSASAIRSTGDNVLFEVDGTLTSLDRGSLIPVSTRDYGEDDVSFAAAGEHVYVATNPSTNTNGTVYALNASDLGDEAWTASPKGSDTTPRQHEDVAVTDDLVITAADERVFAFDRESGDIVWEDVTWNQLGGFSGVTVADGVLYATGTGVTNTYDTTLVYDVSTGARISALDPWSNELTVTDGTVLQGTRNSVIAYRSSGPPVVENVTITNVSTEAETISVNATVTNPYDHEMLDVDVDLYEDGAGGLDDRVSIALEPGETREVTTEFDSLTSYGDYHFRVMVVNADLECDPKDAVCEAVSGWASTTVEQHESIGPADLDGVVTVDARLEADELWVGDTVNLTVDLVNVGDAEAERTLFVDPDSFDMDEVEETFSVPAGSTETVQIPLTGDDTDEDFSVLLKGTQVGTLDIVDDTVELFDLGDLEDELALGSEGPFTLEFYNEGNRDNETTVNVVVDGQTVHSEDVVFTADEETTFEFTHAFDTPGDRNLTIEFENETDVTATFEETVTVSREAWAFSTGDAVDSSPTVVDGVAYVGSRDGNVYAIDAENGTEEWQFTTANSVLSSPTVADGTVYVGSNDNSLYALNIADGSEKWSKETGDSVGSSPTIADGTVYVGSFDNHVYAFDAGTGDEEWSYESDGAVSASPTVAYGVVYVGSIDGTVYALDAESGTELWNRDLGAPIRAAPTVENRSVYVRSDSTSNTVLYVLDAATGDSELLHADTTSWYSETSPTVADGVVYDGRFDGSVYAIDAEDGTEEWRSDMGIDASNWIYSSPTVADGAVYVGSYDGKLYALDSEDGSVDWDASIGSQIDSSPTVVNGTVYVGSDDDAVYALGADGDGTSEDSRVRLGTLGHHEIDRPADPLAVFLTETDDPSVDGPVSFDAGYSNAVGEGGEYRWDFDGDGQPDETTNEPTITHTFIQSGEYDVTLTVANATGATDSMTRTVTVEGPQPSFEIDAIETNEPVVAGGPFEVTATVENTGGQGEETVKLFIESSPQDSDTVTLDAGDTTTVTFEVSTGDAAAGEYTFTVQTKSDVEGGTFNVTEPEPDAGVLQGTVVDADGAPVAGVTVYAVPLEGGSPETVQTGPDGTYEFPSLPAGTYDVEVDADGYQVATSENVLVEAGETTTENVTLPPEETSVVKSSVRHVDGATPDLENVTLDVFAVDDQLQIQLTNDTAASDDLESRYELDGLGADATTELEIEVQVEGIDPLLLVGSGNVSGWDVVDNGDGTTNVTVTTRPIDQQMILDCETYQDTCTPPTDDWPEGDADNATVQQGATVDLTVIPTPAGEGADVLRDATVTTDAQAFGTPVYDPEAEQLSVFVAAPHETVDGEQNKGFYDAFLPASLLSAWDVDPDSADEELTAAFEGEEKDFSADAVDGGVELSIDMTYSAGDVTISTANEETAAFTVEPDEPAVGDEVTFNASDSDAPDGEIAEYRWDFDGDGEVDETTTEPVTTYTFEEAGEYDVTLTVIGSDDTTDSTTQTVSVGTGGDDGTPSDDDSPDTGIELNRTDRVSTHQPAEITATSSDANPNQTTVGITNTSTDAEERRWDVTDDLTGGETTVVWDATDANGDPVETGQYTITVRSDDAAGNVNSTDETVHVDTTDPMVGLAAIDAADSATSPPDGRTVRTNGTLSVSATADGTPGDAENVTASLVSRSTNFEHVFDLSSDESGWTATAELDREAVPDDGTYDVNLIATDLAGNTNETTADVTVELDRDAPELGATVSHLDADTGAVNVTASEPLSGVPTIEVDRPSEAPETVDVAGADARWNATFDLAGDGDYAVSVSGVDRAGNAGADTASATIERVSTENNSMIVLNEETGTFVNFTTTEGIEDTFVSVSVSDVPPGELAPALSGVSFLTSELSEDLYENLSHADVYVPIDATVPGEPEDAAIYYFNESKDEPEWEAQPTDVLADDEIILQEDVDLEGSYWVATVEQFSTYGTAVQDVAPPSIDDASPTGELDTGTTEATVRFEYSDELSGVDPSSVQLSFDGADVTDAEATSITSGYAEFEATGLVAGEGYEVEVTVEDQAGNDVSDLLDFSVAEAEEGDDDGGDDDGSGSTGPPSTSSSSSSSSDDAGSTPDIEVPDDVEALHVEAEPVEVDEATGLARVEFGEEAPVERIEFAEDSPDGEVTVAELSAEPAETSEVPGATVSVTQIAVPDGAEDTPATVRTRVDAEALAELDAAPEELRVSRFADGAWQGLETTVVEASTDVVVLEAETPGFSFFAVSAVSEPEADISVDTASVSPGEEVGLSAAGSTDRFSEIVAYEWSVGERRLDGETATVVLDEPGEYTVELTVRNDAGETATTTTSVTVEPEPTTAATEIPETDGPATTESPGMDGFGAAAALVAIAVTVVARRRLLNEP